MTESVGDDCVAVKGCKKSVGCFRTEEEEICFFFWLQDRWESVELGKVGSIVLLSIYL